MASAPSVPPQAPPASLLPQSAPAGSRQRLPLVVDPSPPSSPLGDAPPPADAPADPRQPPRSRPWLLPLLAVAALLGGGGWWASRWNLVDTDNAQVQSHLTELSSRMPATIARVLVANNQLVKAGQPLVLFDDRDARARLFSARADLEQAGRAFQALDAQAGASATTARAAEGTALADQQAASSELARSAADAQRLVALAQAGGVSRQTAERAVSDYRKAAAAFTQSQASRQTAAARLQEVRVDQHKAAAAQAKVFQAQAALAEAQLNLSYTRLLAPSAGRIGSLQAEPGRQVLPSQPLLTIVDPHPWVEANFKETQLTGLHPGQAAEVRIDAYPDRLLRGRLSSLAPAAGSRFTLLPPDNATGNFTKVVQRITARIDLDPRDLRGLDLVPGLSATVSVRRP
ncbi:MAG: HlyD family secretion protein [Cyanobacteriota bacterium]|nr:HlyD family secretion protein [Cyanobacteriota bacterium]